MEKYGWIAEFIEEVIVVLKNLKNDEEHQMLFKAICEGNAKIVTYGMTDSHYNRFAKDFLSKDNVLANIDSDPDKCGKRLEMGAITLPLDKLPEMSEKSDGIVIMSGALSEIGESLDNLGQAYYCGRIFESSYIVKLKKQAHEEKEIAAKNRQKIDKVRSLLADSHSRSVYDAVLSARASGRMMDRINNLKDVYNGPGN
jgi:hypothetical protein